MDKLVNVDTLSEALGIARSMVYRMASREEIPVIKAGRHFRFDLAEVIAALRTPAAGSHHEKDPDGEPR